MLKTPPETSEAETINQTRRCIYCNEHKPSTQFSLEHIFPNAIGGNVCPDFFKTRDVCQQCNSIVGLFVDGPVIKSWFTKNAEATAYRDFVDIKDPQSWMPFAYMGLEQKLRFGENEVCEIWLGPFGEHVYHIHDADNPQYDSYAGGNPINRRSDPGRTYLFLTVSDPEKCGLTIRSFTRQFKKAARYAGNFEIEGQNKQMKFISSLPDNLTDEHLMLTERARSGQKWNIRLTNQVGFEERFLAKIARGVGYKLFGHGYLDTPYGAATQRALWEQDRSVRERLIRGTPLFSAALQPVKDRLGLPGTYCILLQAVADVFFLVLTLPDGNNLSVVISDEPALWSGREFNSYQEGVIYIIAPQLQTCSGPLAFPEFLSHVIGNTSLQAIASLESKRIERYE